jgi:predicted nucleic acid-binding protein
VSGDVVLDASVAVKWIREEPGSAAARDLLRRHVLGELRIWMPEQCVAELLAVVRRTLGPTLAVETWRQLRRARLAVAPLNDGLVERAARICAKTGCAFYDALAPALAETLGSGLVSADRRAHSEWPGVELLG